MYHAAKICIAGTIAFFPLGTVFELNGKSPLDLWKRFTSLEASKDIKEEKGLGSNSSIFRNFVCNRQCINHDNMNDNSSKTRNKVQV